MNTTTALFYIFSAVLLVASFRVITARSTVHAALFLVLAFVQSSVLWLLIEAEFLAIALVLVYVGAVMVLFLFVVMMLDINVEQVSGGFARYLPLGLVVAGLMVVELAMVIWRYSGDFITRSGFAQMPEGYSNTEALGAVLYTEHVYAFEIAAVILLLAIISAITLTMRRRPGLKQQNVARQVAVRAKDRIRIVKMPAERPEGEGQS